MARKKFRIFINSGRIKEFLGVWPTEREAKIAYDRAALYFGVDPARFRIPLVSRAMGPASPKELRRLGRLSSKALTKGSRYKGLSFLRGEGAWTATIGKNYRTYYLGRFRSEEQAAAVYDEAALFLFGKDAELNLPERNPRPRSPAEIARDRAALHFGFPVSWLNFPELAYKLEPVSPELLGELAHRDWKTRTTSRYRGVQRHRDGPGWTAGIYHHSKLYLRIGTFESEDEAAMAYDRAARRLHGKRARLNFPE